MCWRRNGNEYACSHHYTWTGWNYTIWRVIRSRSIDIFWAIGCWRSLFNMVCLILFNPCSTSEKSRNFTVGYRLGQGQTLSDIIQNLGSVAEGVSTTKAAFELASRLQVDGACFLCWDHTAPITTEVYAVLYEEKPVKEAMKTLMERDPSRELRGIVHSPPMGYARASATFWSLSGLGVLYFADRCFWWRDTFLAWLGLYRLMMRTIVMCAGT